MNCFGWTVERQHVQYESSQTRLLAPLSCVKTADGARRCLTSYALNDWKRKRLHEEILTIKNFKIKVVYKQS